jgi:glyoxylase-like metal-dependent hydrolase (beta-lactamase superfamily II)
VDGEQGTSRPGTTGSQAIAAQRQAWLEGSLPPVEEIRPGLWSIPVAWPYSPLRYTLSYLLRCQGGVALIDTGWPTDQGWAALVGGIQQAGHDLSEVRYVLVTHAHADHLGMAGRVREASGARVGMHPAETATLNRATSPMWRTNLADWLRCRGAPQDQASELLDRLAPAAERYASLASPDFPIEHGSRPLGIGSPVRAVWTPGHTPGHLCFYDERQELLLTGDHVLPRITPHIGLRSKDQGDPLGDFQASLRVLAQYDPAEVLPAHEFRFTDLGARIDTLLLHHKARLAEIEQALASGPGLSTWAVAESLTWSRGWEGTHGHARHAALTETWAHLVHLQAQGRVLDQGSASDSWVPGPALAGRGR